MTLGSVSINVSQVPDIGDLNSVALTIRTPGGCHNHAKCVMCDAVCVIMPCTILMALTLKTQSMERVAGHYTFYTGCVSPILV